MDAFDALLSSDLTDLFAVEQRLRREGALAVADRVVVHRAALLAGGASALKRGAPLTWLTAPPLPRRALWGHRGAVVAARADASGTRLVTLGADRRLRAWTPDGLCLVDLEAEGEGLALGGDGMILVLRSGGEVLCWSLDGTPRAPLRVEGLTQLALRDGQLTGLTEDDEWIALSPAGEVLRRVPLPEGRGSYCWRSGARLQVDGGVQVCISEDDPGGLYSPSESWFAWDPDTGEQTRLRKPTTAPTALGDLIVHAMPDGALYLQPPEVPPQPPPLHEGKVLVLGMTGDLLVSGGEGFRSHLQLSDLRTGAPLRQTERHRDLDRLVLGERAVSLGRYFHPHARAPTAKLWDLETGACQGTISAGGGYQARITASPDGRRLAWTDRQVLKLATTARPEQATDAALPWQWDRDLFWAPDGASLVVQLHGRAVSVWSLAAQTRQILTTEVLDSAQLALSADDAVVLTSWSHYRFHALRLDGRSIGGLPRGLTAWTFAAGEGGRYGIAGLVQGGLLWMDLVEQRKGLLIKQAGRITQSAAEGQEAVWASEEGVGLVDLPARAVRWRQREGLGEVHALAIGDAHVFAGCAQGRLTTLSRESGAILRQQAAHSDAIRALAVLPGGDVLSADARGALRRWPAGGGEGALVAELGSSLYDFSVRGDRILLRTKDGQQLRRLSDWASLPLPPAMGRGLLVGEGDRVVSLDRIAQVMRFDCRSAQAEPLAAWGEWAPSRQTVPLDGALHRLEPGALVCRGPHPWRLPGAHRRLLLAGDRLVVESSDGGLLAISRDGRVLWERPGAEPWVDIQADARSLLAVREGLLVVLSLADGAEVGRWHSGHRWQQGAVRGDRVAAGDEQGEVHLWALER